VIQGHSWLMQHKVHPGKSAHPNRCRNHSCGARAATSSGNCQSFQPQQVMHSGTGPQRHLANVIKMLERLVRTRAIDFHPSEIAAAILADSSMVEQIAMNLAVNARDADAQCGGNCLSPLPGNHPPGANSNGPECRTENDDLPDFTIMTKNRENPPGNGGSEVLGRSLSILHHSPSERHPAWACPRFRDCPAAPRLAWKWRSKPNQEPRFRVYLPRSRKRRKRTG